MFTPTSIKRLSLNTSLENSFQLDVRLTKLFELRFFGGLNVDETAKVLNCSASTVKRDWSLAKAWLFRELGKQ